MKILETRIIDGRIRVLTGLHIGAGKDAIEIGGVDSPVVKNPYTEEPYIPGSSLKGKLRCLMEWASGRVREDGKTWDGGDIEDPDELASELRWPFKGSSKCVWETPTIGSGSS